MGSWIGGGGCRNISISDARYPNEFYHYIGDIDDEFLDGIIADKTVKQIQINFEPDVAFLKRLDRVFSKREDITFRIYQSSKMQHFDLDLLLNMPHLKSLYIYLHLVANPNIIEVNKLTKLHLHTLALWLFNHYDYSFLKDMPKTLKRLDLDADALKSIKFDCKWLLDFPHLEKLTLCKKARKNIKELQNLKSLKSLTIRGIKIDDYSILENLKLEHLSLLYCTIPDPNQLKCLTSLKSISLWRNTNLSDVSFLKDLINLETITLYQLKHVKYLPDLSSLKKLKTLDIAMTGIDTSSLPDNLRKLLKYQ